MKLLLIFLALVYILSPYDLVSDFLAGWGWLDDLMVLALLWKYVISGLLQNRLYSKARPWYTRTGGSRPSGRNQTRDNFSGPHQASEEKSPYTILGVDENASAEEIKKAYKELVNKYHPDKVHHLGDEFRDLAEKKFKEIQEAYQKLCPK